MNKKIQIDSIVEPNLTLDELVMSIPDDYDQRELFADLLPSEQW